MKGSGQFGFRSLIVLLKPSPVTDGPSGQITSLVYGVSVSHSVHIRQENEKKDTLFWTFSYLVHFYDLNLYLPNDFFLSFLEQVYYFFL